MSDPKSDDERRHKIFFQINDQHSYGFGKLTTSQYVKLKYNDAAAYEFVLDLYESKKISIAEGAINDLFRSMDDVDYTPVILPKKTSPSPAEASSPDDAVKPGLKPKTLSTSNSTVTLQDIEPSTLSSIKPGHKSKTLSTSNSTVTLLNNKPSTISSSISKPSGSNDTVKLSGLNDKIKPSGSNDTVKSKDEPKVLSTVALQCKKTSDKSMVQLESIAIADSDDDVPKSDRQPLRTKKGSDVWRHFKREDQSSARCIICNNVLKHSGNTTNLTQHLTRRHALLCPSVGERKRKHGSSEVTTDSDVKRMNLTTKDNQLRPIEKAFDRMNSFAEGGKTSDKVTNAILYMVAVDEMPFSTVENEGFRTLIKTVAPLYTIPSRRTLTKLLDSRYDVLKERCKNNLQQVSSFSLTCDVWTDVSNQSYLGVSIHYLSEELMMKSGCLGMVPLYEAHTAEYLAESLNSVIDGFELDRSKIMAIICDNGANIKKAVTDVVGKEKRLPCFAHTLSHLVPDAMATTPVLTNIIAKVKGIVTITRGSVVASDELRRLQIRDGKTDATALKFIKDVPTRWNSTLYMIERFLLLQEYVYPVQMKCHNSPDMLTREEIPILDDTILLMKPIENVIKEISGDSYPSSSIIIPIIRCMAATIEHVTPITELGFEFKTKLQNAINIRFQNLESNPVLGVAAILDPRFKRIYFQNALAASTAIARINNKIKNSDEQILSKIAKESEPPTKSSESVWEIHDAMTSKNCTVSTNDEGTSLEVRQYWSQPAMSRFKSPLAHWKSLEHAFPALFKIAKAYLSVVGTSVPSERMFSQAGHIKSDNRNRLSVNPEAGG